MKGVVRNAQPTPIIIDLDTGGDQVNSQREEALHQFLQLKHGCKLSLQSLKSVFISNVSFFKLYDDRLYGMSGTLGSNQEREKVVQINQCDFVNVPTFIPKRFKELTPLLCEDYNIWLNTITKVCVEIGKTRAVLVICETIQAVTKMYNKLLTEKSLKVNAFRREQNVLDANLSDLNPGNIVVATNIAGRCMDLKLSNETKKAGGLHVLITNLPNNVRVEMQAFGRASRAGDAVNFV